MNQDPMRSHASGHTSLDLVELLDQLIDSGTVGVGDLLLSVAGIDLVHLELRLALHGIDEQGDRPAGVDAREQPAGARTRVPPGSPPRAPATGSAPTRPRPDRPARELAPEPPGGRRTDSDPHEVQRSLAALVLTLVDILRELMERQAIRRMEAESLTDHEVERLGRTLLAMRQRIEELREAFAVPQPANPQA